MKNKISEYEDLTPKEKRLLVLIIAAVGSSLFMLLLAIAFFVWTLSIQQ